MLDAVKKKEPKGVLVDISMLDLLDSYAASVIIKTVKIIHLLGACSVLIGLKPEVASYLTQMNFDFSAIHTTKHINEGIEFLNNFN